MLFLLTIVIIFTILFSFSLFDSISIIPPPTFIILNAILAFRNRWLNLVTTSLETYMICHNPKFYQGAHISDIQQLTSCLVTSHQGEMLTTIVLTLFVLFLVLHMKYLFKSFCYDFHSYKVKLRIHVSKYQWLSKSLQLCPNFIHLIVWLGTLWILKKKLVVKFRI